MHQFNKFRCLSEYFSFANLSADCMMNPFELNKPNQVTE